jgi:hypothetical protein
VYSKIVKPLKNWMKEVKKQRLLDTQRMDIDCGTPKKKKTNIYQQRCEIHRHISGIQMSYYIPRSSSSKRARIQKQAIQEEEPQLHHKTTL